MLLRVVALIRGCYGITISAMIAAVSVGDKTRAHSCHARWRDATTVMPYHNRTGRSRLQVNTEYHATYRHDVMKTSARVARRDTIDFVTT